MGNDPSKEESYNESRKFEVCDPSTGKPIVGVEHTTRLKSTDIAGAQKEENERHARQMKAIKNFVSLGSEIGIENVRGQMSILEFHQSPETTMLSKSDCKF
ncbi:hypothetical protein ACOMHN_060099 [Nucella lapillus]